MQSVLAELIARDFSASRDTLITVTRVKASGNLQEAKVYISVLPDQKRDLVVNALEKEIVFFQKTLNRKLRMRPVPKIIFVPDTNPAQAQQVEMLLEELKDTDKH